MTGERHGDRHASPPAWPHDAAGNANTGLDQHRQHASPTTRLAPTVTINQAAGQADPTNASPINFTVVFSEAVTDFATGDVTLSGTAGATTAHGDRQRHDLQRGRQRHDRRRHGDRHASPPARRHDAAGNPNTASTSTDNTVTYDTTAPTVTVDSVNGSSVTIPSTPNQNVTRWVPRASRVTAPRVDDGSSPTSPSRRPTPRRLDADAEHALSAEGTYTYAASRRTPQQPVSSGDKTVTFDKTAPTVTINQAATRAIRRARRRSSSRSCSASRSARASRTRT